MNISQPVIEMGHSPLSTGIILRRYVPFFLILLTTLFSCASAGRSTRGLNARELNLSYMPPYSGAVRYGITNRLEGRVSSWLETGAFDLYLHSPQDEQILGYGLALGTYGNFSKHVYFTSGTLGTSIHKRFYPYITYTAYFPKHKHLFGSYDISLGCEARVYKTKKTKILITLTPEIIYAPYFYGYPFWTKIVGTIGLGITLSPKD